MCGTEALQNFNDKKITELFKVTIIGKTKNTKFKNEFTFKIALKLQSNI